MQRERVTRKSQSAMLVGWVSTTDAIFVGLILTLTVTLFVAGRLRESNASNRRMQDDLSDLQVKTIEDQSRLTERERLIALGQTKIDELSTGFAFGQRKLAELAAVERKTNEEKDRLRMDNEKLRAQLAALFDYYANAKKTLELTTADKRDVAVRLVSATAELDSAQREAAALRSQIEAEPGLHKELLGLKGRMQRVVIVFDTSGSMSRDGRWEHARNVVATWLEHLAIRECALVLFSDDARPFPQDGGFLDVHGPNGVANRNRLLNQIRTTKPGGLTNTLVALQSAYRYADVDTVILFTDGEPNTDNSKEFDSESAERIYSLCQKHNQIPVNTVGLGAFYQPQLAGFLMRVAEETGGSFLGR